MTTPQIITAVPIAEPTPALRVPHCFVVLRPEARTFGGGAFVFASTFEVNECPELARGPAVEKARAKALKEAQSYPGAVVVEYTGGDQ